LNPEVKWMIRITREGRMIMGRKRRELTYFTKTILLIPGG
jgi:hypothetical protein